MFPDKTQRLKQILSIVSGNQLSPLYNRAKILRRWGVASSSARASKGGMGSCEMVPQAGLEPRVTRLIGHFFFRTRGLGFGFRLVPVDCIFVTALRAAAAARVAGTGFRSFRATCDFAWSSSSSAR